MSDRVAVVQWAREDGTAREFHDVLMELGYEPRYFLFDRDIPEGADYVLTFAPYGPWIQIPQRASAMLRRPTMVHYNTENPPDPRVPWTVAKSIGQFRSWVGRLGTMESGAARTLGRVLPYLWGKRNLARFCHLGDYYYAYRQGWTDLYVYFSQIYARMYASHGLPAIYVPWGTARNQFADLNLNRDIDVLWMGVRRTRRRSALIETVRAQIQARGRHMYIADGQENPLIFGDTRTSILNRTKIVLSLQFMGYEDVLTRRFHMVAGNRCLVVSEPTPTHNPELTPGGHYVVSPVDQLVETIAYYLEHEQERRQLAENAYQLVTTRLTFYNSVKAVMEAARGVKERNSKEAGDGP